MATIAAAKTTITSSLAHPRKPTSIPSSNHRVNDFEKSFLQSLVERAHSSRHTRTVRHAMLPAHVAGEPFTAEEFEELITAAMDPDKKVVYDEHAELMALEDEFY